jgi:hypothetical protein
MTDRFKVILEDSYDGAEESYWESLLDTKTGQIVYQDGGEPEDMTLGRNLRGLVDLLNRVARGE